MADIIGSADNDSLVGSADNDTINGGLGQDTIEGGFGSDFLAGSAIKTYDTPGSTQYSTITHSGSDVYFFAGNFGQDTISEDENIFGLGYSYNRTFYADAVNQDVIRLGASYSPENAFLEFVDDRHLRLKFQNSTDSILFNVGGAEKNLSSSSSYEEAGVYYVGIESIQFSDGTVWDTIAALRQLLPRELTGDDGGNFIQGSRFQETLIGGAGNDTLVGGDGKSYNTYVGGKGDDLILANDNDLFADDVIRYSAGDGNDTVIAMGVLETILLETGISRDQVRVQSLGVVAVDGYLYNTVKIQFNEFDSLAVAMNQASVSAVSGSARFSDFRTYENIPTIKFQDGSILSIVDLSESRAELIEGSDGNDTLAGWTSGANTFAGGRGNDLIYGGARSTDTFLFNVGDGKDTLLLNNGSSSIVLGAGLTRTDMRVSVSSATPLTVTLAWGSDSLVVNNPSIDVALQFADGATLRLEDAVALVPRSVMNGSSSDDNMSSVLPVSMSGLKGNDSLSGSSWADVIDGGDGNDTINGGSGSDTLRGQSGNDLFYDGLGNDLMEGGAGKDRFEMTTFGQAVLGGSTNNDTIIGGTGADFYDYDDDYSSGTNHGNDVILDYDLNVLNQDQLAFDAAYSTSQLWFTRSGQDLKITMLGGTDQGGTVTVQKWFTSSAYRIEKLTANDAASGSTKALTASRVNNLVTAMSRFAPPAPGATAIDANTQAQLATVLASNWK